MKRRRRRRREAEYGGWKFQLVSNRQDKFAQIHSVLTVPLVRSSTYASVHHNEAPSKHLPPSRTSLPTAICSPTGPRIPAWEANATLNPTFSPSLHPKGIANITRYLHDTPCDPSIGSGRGEEGGGRGFLALHRLAPPRHDLSSAWVHSVSRMNALLR